MPDILPPRALPAGRLAGLAATRDFCHGLLAAMLFSWLTQVVGVTAMNLRSLPARRGPSLVAIAGIAGVVAVLTGILSIREGFRSVLELSGRDDVAIVLRGGATSEMSSGLSQSKPA